MAHSKRGASADVPHDDLVVPTATDNGLSIFRRSHGGHVVFVFLSAGWQESYIPLPSVNRWAFSHQEKAKSHRAFQTKVLKHRRNYEHRTCHVTLQLLAIVGIP